MTDRTHYLQDALNGNEPAAAIESFQRLLVERGLVPDQSHLPHNRSRLALRVLVALVLALNVAALVLLGNFIVFNMMLHVSL